ncbi:MAG: hypothetical protein CR988_01625 [Treponema sp.]|nr:MAG: hypothetical protein CR988_01625 [Treponema sp.]
MHNNCNGNFQNGKDVVDKVRAMGFASQPMPLTITCENCQKDFEMQTFEDACPECKMVYAVTPCHAFDPTNVMAAEIEY